MTRDLLFVQQISLQADTFYHRAEELGQLAAHPNALGSGKTQMRGLERVANSSARVSDVVDYLKKQTGKAKRGESWRHRGQGQDLELGTALIAVVGLELRDACDHVCGAVGAGGNDPATPLERQRTHLALIRAFVAQLAAHCEWRAADHGA